MPTHPCHGRDDIFSLESDLVEAGESGGELIVLSQDLAQGNFVLLFAQSARCSSSVLMRATKFPLSREARDSAVDATLTGTLCSSADLHVGSPVSYLFMYGRGEAEGGVDDRINDKNNSPSLVANLGMQVCNVTFCERRMSCGVE